MGVTTTIALGSGQTVITDFIAVGRGIFISDAWKAVISTLKFEGAGLTADNIIIKQVGADTLISFDGIDPANTSVLLKNVDYQMLDNVPFHPVYNPEAPFGNFIFDGHTIVTDNIDLFNRDDARATIFNEDSVTFLNDKANTVNGFDGSDDVINAMGGNDTVFGLSGNDFIRGQLGDDTLDGGLGNDELDGGDGRDVLYGQDGNDLLIGQVPLLVINLDPKAVDRRVDIIWFPSLGLLCVPC